MQTHANTFPKNKINILNKCLQNPFLTRPIPTSMNEKHKLNERDRRGIMPECLYTSYAKWVDSNIKTEKKKCYPDRFERLKDDPKSAWRLTYKIIGDRLSQNNRPVKLNINKNVTKGKHLIINKLNTFVHYILFHNTLHSSVEKNATRMIPKALNYYTV